MLHTIDRRQFLRGRFRNPGGEIPPPWSGPRDEFIERCTRCGACLAACPADILVTGDGGFPKTDFERGECFFCGDCVTSCQPRALQARRAPWHLQPTVHETCLAWQGIDCRRCVETCGTGAISMVASSYNKALPVVNASLCTGCGACVAPCPVLAMRLNEVA